jgi:hypothetical protein
VPARARRLFPLAVALMLCLAAAPAALGAPLKAPKWMKKPYRPYTLTAQYGTDEEAGETDTGGSSCYGSNDSYQSSFKGHGTLTYHFLFGRWHDKKTGKYDRVCLQGRAVREQRQWERERALDRPAGLPGRDQRQRVQPGYALRQARGGSRPRDESPVLRKRHGA